MQTTTLFPGAPEGFSLIEVLIALAAAAIGLLAAGQLMYSAASAGSLARSKGAAVLAARNTIADLSELYSRDPSHEDLVAGDHGPREISVTNPIDNTVLNHFRITWSTAAVADPRPGKNFRALSVRVTVTPIQLDGTPGYSPQFNRILTFETIFSPVMP
jgi:prepilin-type N-terminal cleavage/methylation domain-containing protein